MNLAMIIADHAAERPALIFGDTTVTYGELRRRVDAMRERLTAGGVGADDRVMIACGNHPDFVVAALATLGVGGVVVPLNAQSPLPELEQRMDLVQPAAIAFNGATAEVGAHAEKLGTTVIDMRVVAEAVDAGPIVPRSEDDLACLMLTSGVTGQPKAAMLSHGNLAWAQEITVDGPQGLGPDDVVLGVLPFAHIFGLNVVLFAALRAGATIVLVERFDAAHTIDLIMRHRVSRVAGVPPMWKRWAEADAPNDAFASVTYAASGAAALPMSVFVAVRDRYGLEVGEGYGLTETSPIVTHSRGVAPRPGSVGKVAEGVQVALVDDDGTPVDHGDIGEIVVRSPGVFKGYLDDPDTTHSVLTDDGWFWTGDVGVFDDEGYLHLVDRVKDLIIVSGFNVYPAEVESVLLEHPDVRGAVVVGAPDVERGEAVVAYVSGRVDEEDLRQFVRSRMSGYKCPTQYHFVDELPMAPSGKVVRRDLR